MLTTETNPPSTAPNAQPTPEPPGSDVEPTPEQRCALAEVLRALADALQAGQVTLGHEADGAIAPEDLACLEDFAVAEWSFDAGALTWPRPQVQREHRRVRGLRTELAEAISAAYIAHLSSGVADNLHFLDEAAARG